MKKAIIYSILISLILIGGAYYYFFIFQAEPEAPTLPAKVKLVMPKITSIQIAKDVSKEPKKEEKKVEVKKEEPKDTKQQEKKVEPKKVEPKKDDTKKAETKEVVQEKKDETKKKEEPKKVRFYQIVANYTNEEEAINVRNNLISLGYHTAKFVKKGGNNLVVLSPFTDYYEAEYVRKNIEMEAKRREFKTKAVY